MTPAAKENPMGLAVLCIFTVLAAACGSSPGGATDVPPSDEEDERREQPAPPDAVPATVALRSATVTSGFAGGVLRQNVDLSAFEITRHPITRGEYQECVDAAACKPAKDQCAPTAYEMFRGRDVNRDDSPQTCLSVRAASEYCRWIGGRLPKLAEWFLAARGTEPQKYAWGATPPTCEQHPRAAELHGAFLSDEAAQEAGCVPSVDGRLEIGDHEDGDAPSGMSDVLLTPGELLASEANAQFSACSDGFGGCYVYGPSPGAIAAVYPIDRVIVPVGDANLAPHVYGFRCVIEEN